MGVQGVQQPKNGCFRPRRAEASGETAWAPPPGWLAAFEPDRIGLAAGLTPPPQVRPATRTAHHALLRMARVASPPPPPQPGLVSPVSGDPVGPLSERSLQVRAWPAPALSAPGCVGGSVEDAICGWRFR
jgi:hypothetical protein